MNRIKVYNDDDIYTMLRTMNTLACDMNTFTMNSHMCHNTSEYCSSCEDKEFCNDTLDLKNWSDGQLAKFK